MLPTIAWQDSDIVMIDQRKLPGAEVYVTCRSVNDVAKAIKTMIIRGAPAIGVCAAMGLALGAQRSKATGTKQFTTEFQRNSDLLAATRPTAVNLFWAIERMKQSFADGALAGESVEQLKARLRLEADRIHDDDVASCRAIGALGATLVPAEACILTHCNAGALATAGYGTALGVIRGAVEAGRKVRVLAVTGDKRLAKLPDVPTVKEAGIPKMFTEVSFFFVAPAGTPKDVVTKLNAAITTALKSKETEDRLANISVQTKIGTPGEVLAHIKQEMAKWSEVVKAVPKP